MASDVTATLDEAYQRLHKTGPEFDGWLSNHGPTPQNSFPAKPERRPAHGRRTTACHDSVECGGQPPLP
jgi:hypothetical protein